MTVAANGQELAIQSSTALAIRPGQEMWNDKQRAALAVLGIKNAANADLAVFMHYCQKTGLDPFSRQIYMICRREKQGDQWVDKQTIQVGIDGFRVIRDRIAARLGVTVEYGETIWYDADGGAHKVWLWDQAPAACRVDVYKNGQLFPGVVRTSAYAAKNRDGDLVAQWRTQPDHMIEKCAEVFALRRAFPHDLGGIYLEDEMPAQPADAQQPSRRVTAADLTIGPAAAITSPVASNQVAKQEAPPENGRSEPPGPEASESASTRRGGVHTGPGTIRVTPPGQPEPADRPTAAASAAASEEATRPASAAAPAPTPPAPSGDRRRVIPKTMLGNLRDALAHLVWEQPGDDLDAVSALTGRPVKMLEELSREEGARLLALIDAALNESEGDRGEATSEVWRQARLARIEQAAPGGDTRA
jgi:phage recombination protein Bet